MPCSDLNTISAVDFQQRVAEGYDEPAALIDACFTRIADREEDVCAWQHLQEKTECLNGLNASHGAALSGIPIGVKDNFDTQDMPTTWGTSYLRSERSPWDAAAITLLRRAGATIVGKTVSTELAYFTPGKTRNPLDYRRTPGGSSSGSAAAVAAGMVPLALGTQTAGSIIRPASFCGVIGFKPTFNTVPLAGVKGFSPSLDTVGWFARSVDDIALAFAVLTASPPPKIEGLSLYGLRVGVRALPLDGPLTVDTVSVLGATRRMLLKAGAQVTELDLPANFDALVDVQKCVMAYEAARTLAFEYDTYRDQMGPKLVAIIEQGLAVAPEDYRAAIQATAWHRREIAKRFTFDLDVILAPSVNGEAPLGHDATGDPLYCRAWTLLGLPCISLPIGKGVHGMPIGMQFIGAEGADAKLLSIAKAIMLTTHDGSSIESA